MNCKIGKAATLSSCQGNLVESSKPASGIFLKRLMGSDCGDQMPMNLAPLPDTQMQCIVDWLNSKL